MIPRKSHSVAGKKRIPSAQLVAFVHRNFSDERRVWSRGHCPRSRRTIGEILYLGGRKTFGASEFEADAGLALEVLGVGSVSWLVCEEPALGIVTVSVGGEEGRIFFALPLFDFRFRFDPTAFQRVGSSASSEDDEVEVIDGEITSMSSLLAGVLSALAEDAAQGLADLGDLAAVSSWSHLSSSVVRDRVSTTPGWYTRSASRLCSLLCETGSPYRRRPLIKGNWIWRRPTWRGVFDDY